jgi:hypothetical protein
MKLNQAIPVADKRNALAKDAPDDRLHSKHWMQALLCCRDGRKPTQQSDVRTSVANADRSQGGITDRWHTVGGYATDGEDAQWTSHGVSYVAPWPDMGRIPIG